MNEENKLNSVGVNSTQSFQQPQANQGTMPQATQVNPQPANQPSQTSTMQSQMAQPSQMPIQQEMIQPSPQPMPQASPQPSPQPQVSQPYQQPMQQMPQEMMQPMPSSPAELQPEVKKPSSVDPMEVVANLNKEDAMEEALSHTTQYSPFEETKKNDYVSPDQKIDKKTLIFIGVIFVIMILFIIFLPQISKLFGL